ncbi:MAG: hypothetical protein INF97_05060 [Roseomonas sp.]|nr:hypothetical protein [Roseomonas sp.]
MAKLFSAVTRKFTPLALLVLALGLSACASGAKPTVFVPPISAQTSIAANSNLRDAVAVGFTGGPEMTEALTLSLAAREMLARSDERFRLEAGVVRVPPPPRGGIDLELTSTFRYRLVRVADNMVVFDREITASYTATLASAPIIFERRRLAIQGTIRENINEFLTALIAEERANPQAFSSMPRPRRS